MLKAFALRWMQMRWVDAFSSISYRMGMSSFMIA